MKRSPLALLLVVSLSFSSALAQVGIGTESPNPKSVLDLKSPGNNQGFLVPRLTTAQRTGMTGLSVSEKGLLVFDTDTNKFYYWSSTAWIVIEDSTGTDSQTLSFNPGTGLLSITGGNGINLGGVSPGGSAGGDLTGTYPNPTVAANAVTSAKISDGTIATADLADGSVTTAKVVDGTITNTDINASAAIAVTKFAPGTSGQVLLTTGTTPTWSNMPGPSGAAGGDLTGTYPNPTINLGAVITNRLADNAITSLKILDGAILTSKIADAAINTLKLLDGAVTSAKILDGTIATADIVDGAISTLKIVDGAVTSTKILDGTIATADILDGAISTLKIADNGVTTAKILDGTLATADLADGAITSIKVLDGAITSAKVLDGAIATADVADGAITSVKVVDGAITSAKVLDGAIATADVADGAITSVKVVDGAITSAKVLDGAIVNNDINAAAGIAISKFAAGTAGQIMLTLGTTPTWSGIGGDLSGSFPNPTIATGAGNNLVTAINNTATTGAISTAKLNTSVVLDTESPASGDVSGSFNGGIQINANAVSTSEIQDGGIGTADIANAAITDAKIATGIDISKLTASASSGFVLTSVLGNVTWAALPVLGLGTVTSVGTGAGLTGGPIITSGTISLADNGVTTIKVADDAITSAKLQDDATTDANRAVTTNHIRDNAIVSSKITDGTVTSADIANLTIATGDIADAAVTNVKIASGITFSKLSPSGNNGEVLTTVGGVTTWAALPASGTGSVTSVATGAGLTGGPVTTTGTISLADNGVTTIKVADDAITSAKLQDDATTDANRAVTTNHLRDNAIVSSKINDGAIVTADLADGSVNSLKVLDNSIASTDILDGTVSSADITNLTIATGDIADAAVTDLKIASGITFSKLSPSGNNGEVLTTVGGVTTWAALPASGTGSVTSVATGAGLTGGPVTTTGTISLADNGVTTIKVADDAITSAKLQDDATTDANRAVTTNHLRDNAIVSSKITDGTIATADLADGSVNSLKVLDNSIASADILDGTILNADINPSAAVAVSKLAGGATGNVLTTLATGVPTWQAPVDNTLSEVLTADNDAGGLAAINFSTVTIGSTDTRGALNVTGSHYRSFTLLGSVANYSVLPADNIIIGTNAGGVITLVTLPAGTASIGRVLTLRGRSVGSVAAAGIRVQASGTETIDGVTLAPYNLTPVNGSFISITVLKITASEWITIARSPFN